MSKIALISSKLDLASLNIRSNLISSCNFQKIGRKFDGNEILELKIKENVINIYLINEKLIHAESIDKKIDADYFIFISKHVSKENTPAFTVHPIGNWGKADYGGKDLTLCPSSALLLKSMFLGLLRSGKERNDFQLTMEATHHGPFLEKPVLFVEIGSTEKEWNDPINGKIVADAITGAIGNLDFDNKNDIGDLKNGDVQKTAIGIGGNHYCN
ncbi:hypothetical protein HYX09_02370, partial [Candidatus Woesearchaeota archaeon]|nr:hypothetical protein [Candidatus Woesearchaeota archaeon]